MVFFHLLALFIAFSLAFYRLQLTFIFFLVKLLATYIKSLATHFGIPFQFLGATALVYIVHTRLCVLYLFCALLFCSLLSLAQIVVFCTCRYIMLSKVYMVPLWPRPACRCFPGLGPCSGTAASCPEALLLVAAVVTPDRLSPVVAASVDARPDAAPRSASSCTPADTPTNRVKQIQTGFTSMKQRE